MKKQNETAARQQGVADELLKKYKACFTHPAEPTIHGCVYAVSPTAAYNMLIPPPGYSRDVLEIPRNQACFCDTEFTRHVTCHPAETLTDAETVRAQAERIRDLVSEVNHLQSTERGLRADLAGQVKQTEELRAAIARAKEATQNLTDNLKAYSFERVKAELDGILTEIL